MSTGVKSKKSPKKGGNKEKYIYYDDKCSKLEITLTYNGRSESLSIDNKENISTIKDKIYNIFYPIQGKFQLIYKNKDISPFEDIPLYKYFKNLMKVSIAIQPISASMNQNILTKTINNSFNSSFQDLTVINKNDGSLGNENQSQISNAQNPLIEKDRMLCNDCHNKLITYFCRNCNLFLCKICAEKYSSPHKSHQIVSINPSQIEKSAKSYKDIVSKECFMAGKKFDEYNKNNKPINNENNNELNSNVNEINNIINNTENKENQAEKKEKRDIDGWLNDLNTKIENLGEIFSKNEEVNVNTNFALQDEENNYEYLLKKLQKINAEKNTKDLETIFNEMHDIDLNIKNIDSNLDQCLNNSENSKSNSKVLKDLNKNLDNIINKLVKSLDFTEKSSTDNL
jgi:hypothetical protein